MVLISCFRKVITPSLVFRVQQIGSYSPRRDFHTSVKYETATPRVPGNGERCD